MSSYSRQSHYSDVLNKNFKMFGHMKTVVPNKLGINYKRDGNLKWHIKECTSTLVKKCLLAVWEIGEKN